jgi:hypothetical protein
MRQENLVKEKKRRIFHKDKEVRMKETETMKDIEIILHYQGEIQIIISLSVDKGKDQSVDRIHQEEEIQDTIVHIIHQETDQEISDLEKIITIEEINHQE